MRYIRLSIKEAEHFLEEADDAESFRCEDSQTDEEEKIRLQMMRLLKRKIANARR